MSKRVSNSRRSRHRGRMERQQPEQSRARKYGSIRQANDTSIPEDVMSNIIKAGIFPSQKPAKRGLSSRRGS